MECCKQGRIVRRIASVALAILFALLAVTQVAAAATLEGRVVGVIDGDTLIVLDAGKIKQTVRLAAIDAPEKSQPFGRRAKQNLSQLVFGKPVSVVFTHNDRWRRIVGHVFVDGMDVNLRQVRDGCAWYNARYRYEQNLTDRAAYKTAESEARNARRGLWADRNPAPPWKWRRVKRR
ncbi:MAG: thermonuclease family protein [Gammaproteobacteria bacterium]